MLGFLKLRREDSRGRRYPEPAHPYRNDFQRDRDRVIHARAFRRLEGKTQVFAPGLSDHFRNRLTHTLEVAQIARTVASALQLDEEFTETLALAHDLGHPPFGHAGERELDECMRRFGCGFEHNLHSLRIVDWLERRYARFEGLNLTFEVREGIVKHSREVLPEDDGELAEFLPGQRPPLEAQLLDLADEVAYNTADLDDGYDAGMVRIDEAAEAVPLLASLAEQADLQFPGASAATRFREILRTLINVLVSGLIEGTLTRARRSGVQSVAEIRQLDYRLASFTEETAAVTSQLKHFLNRCVYQSPGLVEERKAAASRVGELFDLLVRNPERLPPDDREELERRPAHRVVCDYIAGMTDAYFLKVADRQ
jgi:dGTPase